MTENFGTSNGESQTELSKICMKVTEEVIGFKSITKKTQKDKTEIIELSKEEKESQSDVNSNAKVKEREKMQEEMKVKVKEKSDRS